MSLVGYKSIRMRKLMKNCGPPPAPPLRLRHPSGPSEALVLRRALRSLIPLSSSQPPSRRPSQNVVWNDPRPFSRIAPRVTCANRVWLPPFNVDASTIPLVYSSPHPLLLPSLYPSRIRAANLFSAIAWIKVPQQFSRRLEILAKLLQLSIAHCKWRTTGKWSWTEFP